MGNGVLKELGSVNSSSQNYGPEDQNAKHLRNIFFFKCNDLLLRIIFLLLIIPNTLQFLDTLDCIMTVYIVSDT